MKNSDDEICRLFEKYVPEVAQGTVEVVSVARAKGDRVLVAVRSLDPAINPVSACVGKGGIQPKSIVRELAGEKLDIVLWSESPERFILSALSPLGPSAIRTPTVKLDMGAGVASVEVKPETFSYLSRQATRVRLASELVGWDIRLVSL